jgi:hypothetical protein
MLEIVVHVLETFLYYRPSRVIAWGLGAAGAASLILAAFRPSELWFGFVLSPICFVGCIASVRIGNWYEACAESRERERSWREKAPETEPPVRGFPVVPPRDSRNAR